jgi:AhpC/TSA antioxidant enzyme
VQLHRARERFDEVGAALVLIGMGTPRHAAWFRRTYAPGLTVLADERRVSYQAAQLAVGSVAELVGPRSVLGGVRHSLRSGVVQGRPVGNVAQLGGALVLAAGGRELLVHRAQNAADSAEPEALLDALPQPSGAAS